MEVDKNKIIKKLIVANGDNKKIEEYEPFIAEEGLFIPFAYNNDVFYMLIDKFLIKTIVNEKPIKKQGKKLEL